MINSLLQLTIKMYYPHPREDINNVSPLYRKENDMAHPHLGNTINTSKPHLMKTKLMPNPHIGKKKIYPLTYGRK